MKPENENLLEDMAEAGTWHNGGMGKVLPSQIQAAMRIFMENMEYKEPQEVCDIIMDIAERDQ